MANTDIRPAKFVVVTDPYILHNELNYVQNIVAVCALNDLIEVFTVLQINHWFKPPTYRLWIRLHSIITGERLGVQYFSSQKDAIQAGKDYLCTLFPLLDEAN